MTMIDLEYESEFERMKKLNSIFDELLYILKEDEITLKSLNDKIDNVLGDYMPKKGFVYIVYVGQNLYKIGATIDIKRRMKELQESRIVRVLRTDRPFEFENKLHNKFNQRRLTSTQELFKLNDEDLVYIHTLPDEDVSDSYSLF